MLRDDPAARKFEALFGPEHGCDKPLERARVRKALTALNSPQWKLPPTFHIGGGDGKGSTIAFMRAIAEAAGLNVHVFTTPHLLDLRERFRIAGKLADTQQLIDTAERLAYLRVDLTQFEAQVVCAFLLFANNDADLAFVESGGGGRDDATNVIPSPIATVLTAIEIDQSDLPSERVTSIAREKSAIMKGGAPMILGRQHEDVKLVIEQTAQRLGTPTFGGGADWNAYASGGSMSLQFQTRAFNLPPPALIGAHQIDNAGLAAAALLAWGDRRISAFAIATGMSTVQWRGRLELLAAGALRRIAGGAEVWVDCGQSAVAAGALGQALRDMERKRPARTAAVIGMARQRNWRGFVQRLAADVDVVIGAPLGPQGVGPTEIADAARAACEEVNAAETLRGAVQAARDSGAERVLICGSPSLAGQALEDAPPIV